MKLIDILVQELPKRGGWLDGVVAITQDLEGELCLWGKSDPFCCDGYWRHPSGAGLCTYWFGDNSMSIADDHASTIVTRTQYESALAKNDGWIEWVGGGCPVDEASLVQVKYRNEKPFHIKGINPAGKLAWSHEGVSGDIVAYRLCKQEPLNSGLIGPFSSIEECIAYADKERGGEAAAQQPVWNGEGLPPVGCECEISFAGESYRKCTVLFTSKRTVLVAHETSNDDEDNEEAFAPEDVQFRPIRSESDKKREEAITRLQVESQSEHWQAPISASQAINIYDAIAAGKIPHIQIK